MAGVKCEDAYLHDYTPVAEQSWAEKIFHPSGNIIRWEYHTQRAVYQAQEIGGIKNAMRGLIVRLNAKARAGIGWLRCQIAFFVLTAAFPLAAADANSRLLLAVRSGNIEAVQAELGRGADVNAPDESCKTALMYSTYYGLAKMTIVQTLLEHGAKVNAQDKDGLTALMLAASGKGGPESNKIVKALLHRGANPNFRTVHGRTALMEAIQPSLGKPQAEIIRALLAKGADPNTRINDEATVLMIASRDGDASIVRALLDYGADVQAGDWEADAEGPSLCLGALDWAKDHPDILKMLSDKGATSKPHCRLFTHHRVF